LLLESASQLESALLIESASQLESALLIESAFLLESALQLESKINDIHFSIPSLSQLHNFQHKLFHPFHSNVHYQQYYLNTPL